MNTTTLIDRINISITSKQIIHTLLIMMGLLSCLSASAQQLSIADTTRIEGTGGSSFMSFVVTKEFGGPDDVSVDYVSSDGTADTDDYTPVNGTLVLPPGVSLGVITVPINTDDIEESDETLTVTLSNPTNAVITDGLATGTIIDDDVAPVISMEPDFAWGEDDSPYPFEVTLDKTISADVTVDFISSHITTSNDDFTPLNGTLTILAGQTSGIIEIHIVDDELYELIESFDIILSNPSYATIGTSSVMFEILDFDDPPVASFSSPSVLEGTGGSNQIDFILSLDKPPVQGLEVSVDYETFDSSATSPEDFTAANSSLVIPAGQTSGIITIPVVTDSLYERSEYFQIMLSNAQNATLSTGGIFETRDGRINNDDDRPTVSVSGDSLYEGTGGANQLEFTVYLDEVSGLDTTVDVQSTDSSATSGDDYTTVSGQAVITAGDIDVTVAVDLVTDSDHESDERMSINISNPINASLGINRTALGYILNDDGFMIGGTTSGLVLGNSVTLFKDSENLVIYSNGAFVFEDLVSDGSSYSITVDSQPTTPNQTCDMVNPSGTISGSDVMDVEVNCTTNTYIIGGSVIGLQAGNNLVLQNNNGDDLLVSEAGIFDFVTTIEDEQAYNVSILSQPSDPIQTCTLSNSAGLVSGDHITSVELNCDFGSDLVFKEGFE